MDRKMVLDRIPRQFCEGPFWGNGKMGAVLYVQDGKLCISVDHVGLWELRETLPDEPKAVFSEILKHKKEYLEGDTAYVEQTDIFEEHIGRTKLPALAMELQLPGSITGFRAETDLEKAETFLSLEMEGDRKAEGRIYLDSCVNILMIELQGEGANSLEVKALAGIWIRPVSGRLKTGIMSRASRRKRRAALLSASTLAATGALC